VVVFCRCSLPRFYNGS